MDSIVSTQFDPTLKEYSVILTTSFYGMNQKMLTKKLISKISVDSNFAFSSYCVRGIAPIDY